jgi:hypothetical protein
MRAGIGTTFGTKQRYDIELGWSMLQANDRVQSVVVSTGDAAVTATSRAISKGAGILGRRATAGP